MPISVGVSPLYRPGTPPSVLTMVIAVCRMLVYLYNIYALAGKMVLL